MKSIAFGILHLKIVLSLKNTSFIFSKISNALAFQTFLDQQGNLFFSVDPTHNSFHDLMYMLAQYISKTDIYAQSPVQTKDHSRKQAIIDFEDMDTPYLSKDIDFNDQTTPNILFFGINFNVLKPKEPIKKRIQI